MISVNHDPVAVLLGGALDEVRRELLAADEEGLRPSHARVLTAIPADGCTITGLATRLGMTKQGAGQLVTTLVATGHVAEGRDPADRRRRVVRRTPDGDRTVEVVRGRVARIEERWAEQVGADRYAAFRATLVDIVTAGRGHGRARG